MRDKRDHPAPGGWWSLTTTVALLSASWWLHAPRVEYLVACTTATAMALACTPWLRGNQRRWAIACGALLVGSIVVGLQAQARLHAIQTDWNALRAELEATGLAKLRGELESTAQDLSETARRALGAAGSREASFRALAGLTRGESERGVAIQRGDSIAAWAGRMRNSPDSLRAPVGVVASPFFLSLYATAQRGNERGIASALVYAAAPADRLSNPLAARVASEAGLSGFAFAPPSDSTPAPDALRFSVGRQPLFDVRPIPLEQDELALRVAQKARLEVGILLALGLSCFLIAAWRGGRVLRWRLAALAAALGCTALVPLNEYSNVSRLFDPAFYYTSLGGPLTANAGALGITSALALLALLAVIRRRGRHHSRWLALVIVVVIAGTVPFLLPRLARGLNTPSYGVSASLWLMWEVPLFLAATAVMLAGSRAGATVLGRYRGLPPWAAPALAAIGAILAPIVWQAPGQWPWWYIFVWIAAIGALALARETRLLVLSAATVAGLGATTLVWARTARSRVDLAQHDVESLSSVDQTELALLDRFGASLRGDPAPSSREALLQRYINSDLAAAAYPAALFAWPTDSAPAAGLQTADFPVDTMVVRSLVASARRGGHAVVGTIPASPALELALAIPGTSGGVTAVLVTPRTHLIPKDPFMRLFGIDLDPDVEPPYTLQLGEAAAPESMTGAMNWRRDGSTLHGDFVARTGWGPARVHLNVELRSLDVLVQRGALIVLLDIAIVAALWTLIVLADGGVGRWLRARRRSWARSYRSRLTLALFAFFVIPAVIFAVWSYRQLANDAAQSRELLVHETLRAVAPDSTHNWVERESDRLATPLLVYRRGELAAASDPLFLTLAPLGRLLQPSVVLHLAGRDEETFSLREQVGPGTAVFGFRMIDRPGLPATVLASPARADELTLGRRRRDLGILVLFATALGALAALWLSGIAARQLARPIGTLRGAALAIAAGDRLPPLEKEPTVEFSPVFTAFRRMAEDLNASRSALEEAQRRLAAVLRNVASGVIAVTDTGHVTLANPRADTLLETPLPPGTNFLAVAPPPLAAIVRRFLREAGEEEAFEIPVEQRQLRGHLTRLVRGGAVVTVDDVSDLARAQRVLAWGEMARQIAHEIKNPLTPIRLGVQHLRRAWHDDRGDFDHVLDENVGRILTEIDRLDEIARSFSRYGSAPEERAAAVTTDVAHVVRDVVGLERMGGDGDIRWRLEGADAPLRAYAHPDELREVLLNVLENARLAHASQILVRVTSRADNGTRDAVITVEDNGRGIPADVMPRIFEPHFSTRTSGSGLGLAISRRLIDAWGGEISVSSAVGVGTTVTIVLRSAGGND